MTPPRTSETSSPDVDGVVQLAVLAMDIACQTDPGDAGSRVTELAAKLVTCTAVDIVHIRANGDLLIPASSDRALSAVTKLVWRRWPPTAGVIVGPGGHIRRPHRDPGYAQQMGAYCRISGERLFELRVAEVGYGYLRFLFRDDDFSSTADEELATAFATHAAISLDRAAQLQKIGNLRTAIETNREIGAAVGILMATKTIGYQESFRLLLGVSQNDNRRLRDVAAEVVYTGALPLTRFGRGQKTPHAAGLSPSPGAPFCLSVPVTCS